MNIVVAGRLIPIARAEIDVSHGSRELLKDVLRQLQRWARPGLAWLHIENGASCETGEAGRLRRNGRGPANLVLVADGKTFLLACAVGDQAPSAEHRALRADMRAAGAEVATVRDRDGALAKLAEWGLIR